MECGPGRSFTLTIWRVDREPLFDEKRHEYLIYQKEECPESRRLHWQTFVRTRRSMRYKALGESLGLLPGEFRAANSRGSVEENVRYCSKLDSRVSPPVEKGTRPKDEQGKRTDLELACSLSSVEEVKRVAPTVFVKYHAGIEKLFGPPVPSWVERTEKPSVSWRFGRTGTGKSHVIQTLAQSLPEGQIYLKDDDVWWPGYNQQEVIVIDDFRRDWKGWSMRYLLRLLDRYPMAVQTKGGYVQINSGTIIITAPVGPSEMFRGGDEGSVSDVAQLLRRIDSIVECYIDPSKDGDARYCERIVK